MEKEKDSKISGAADENEKKNIRNKYNAEIISAEKIIRDK